MPVRVKNSTTGAVSDSGKKPVCVQALLGLIFKYCALLKNHASVRGRTKEQFECEVYGVVWKSRWLLQQHQISQSKHQELGGTVCCTISKTSQYLANPCKKQSWYWTMFLPVFDVNIVTNNYCYIVSGIYVNIHKVEHYFRCKGCNRRCSSQKSLSIHQATIHRIYKKKKKQLLACHICGKSLHLEIH